MSAGQTNILGLPVYDNTDDIDYNELNTANQQLDRLPATVCTSASRPVTNLFQGRLIFETDTKNVMQYDLGGAVWRLVGTDDKLPAPVRGYFITASKNVTATAWADVANDSAKSITVARPCMCIIAWRAELLGVAGTAISARLAYTGGTTGNSYDQMDSGILGALTSFDSSANRQQYTMSLLLGTGTTNFKLQAQRSNATNAVSIASASIAITPMAWGDEFAAGAN